MLGRALKDVKLPFPDDFFPELVVSHEDDTMYRRAAQNKVLETLRDENPATRFHPAQRTDQWKLIGDRLGVQLYRERGVAQGNAVQVVCVGGINGSLEDVMWGLYAATTPAFKTQRSILHADYLDARVLHVLDEEECDEEDTAFSYRFSGLKWLACAASGKLTMHKRDLCWHETMGLAHDAAGQEVGYLTIQSVRVNECPPFDQFGVVRSNANVCYIFRKQPNGSVGVYMKGEHAVGGKSRSWGSDPVIVEMWLAIVNVLECAHSKRLTRMLRGKDLFCATQNKQCEICDQKVRGLKTPENCKICGKNVCDKCRMSKAIYPSKATTQFPCMALFCKRCLSEVKDQTAARAARMSYHSDNTSSHGSGSSTYRQSINNHPSPATMLYPPTMGPPSGRNAPPQLGRSGSVGSTGSNGSRFYNGYHQHYSESTVRSNSPTASTSGQSFVSDYSTFSDSGMGGMGSSFRQPRQQQQQYRGPVSREPQPMHNLRGQQPRRESAAQQHHHQQRMQQQQQHARYTSNSIDSTHDVDSLQSSFHGRMRLSSDPTTITDLSDSTPVVELPSRTGRAHTSAGTAHKAKVVYADDLSDDDEIDEIDDDIHDVIELPSRTAPQDAGPVDVFHEDKLKYINSFSSDSSGNIANPSLSGTSSGAGSAPMDEHQRLMERLLQANMTAEATYLLAKYSSNLAKGSP